MSCRSIATTVLYGDDPNGTGAGMLQSGNISRLNARRSNSLIAHLWRFWRRCCQIAGC